MNLTQEEVRMLAQIERDMDSGKQLFVLLNGERLAMLPEVVEFFALEQGQTISNGMYYEILKKIGSICEEKIALQEKAEDDKILSSPEVM